MKKIMNILWLSLLLFVPNALAQEPQPLPVPDYEESNPDSWNDTRLLFRVTLKSNDDCVTFVNRKVMASTYKEAENEDSCWFPGSSYAKETQVQETGVKYTDSTSTFEETMGWFSNQVQYYRDYRQAQNLPLPCGTNVYQQMQIQDENGEWIAYTHPSNVLTYKITEDSVCVIRNDGEPRGDCRAW